MKQKDNIYLIPNFQPSEIISYFTEQGIVILQSDINKPTFQNTLRIYNSLINFIYPNANYTDVDESRFFLVVYKKIDILLRKLGIDFFELKDLQFPSYKRNLNFLSTIYNFCIYKDSKKEYFEKLLAEKEDQEILLNEINVSINTSETKLKNLKESALKREKENEMREKRINELEEEVKSVYKAQRDKVNKTEEIKRERDELYDKLSSLKLACLNVKQEVKEMKAQIIDDPTKMLGLIEEMQNLIKSEKISIEEFNKKIKYTTEQIESEEAMKLKMQSAIKLALSRKKKIKSILDLQDKIGKIENATKTLTSTTHATNRRSEHLNKQISHVENKIETIKQKDQQNARDLSENLNKLKESYGKVRVERNNYFERIANNQKEIKDLEYSMVQMMNQHQKDMHVLINKMGELKNATHKYFMGLEDFIRDIHE